MVLVAASAGGAHGARGEPGTRAPSWPAETRAVPGAATNTATVKPWATWTPEAILTACHAWHDEHGRPPTADEWRNASPYHPSTRSVLRVFPGWSAMIAAAGFEPRGVGQPAHPWTREDAVRAIFLWVFEHGRLPKCNDWWEPSRVRPTARQLIRLFGSWNAAIVAAGYEPTRRYRTVEGYQKQAAAAVRRRTEDGAFAAGTRANERAAVQVFGGSRPAAQEEH